MVYGKSKYRRKYARKGRSKLAIVAKGRTTTTQALAKAVRSIQRKMRGDAEYLNFGRSWSQSVTADYTAIHLCGFSSWNNIFGVGANDTTANTIIHKSFGIDCYLTLENTVNEPDTTEFTMFLVSLRDSIGPDFNAGTGALTLAPNYHYYINGGLAMLNKKIFKIHKTRRVVLTNHGQALSTSSAQSQGGSDKRFYMRMPVNQKITEPYGDWKSIVAPRDPSQNFYLLIFNNNSAVDLQNPQIRISEVHTMKSVA